MNTIIYKKESYDIIGAAMKVYNFLGHGYLEGVYQEALEIELKRAGIPTERKNYRLSMMVLFYHRNSKLISFAMTK